MEEQEKIILIPVPLDDLLSAIREIVRIEIHNKQQQNFQDKLLSPAEACKIFNPRISKATLHEWTKQGLIPVYRIGGRIFYKYLEAIEAAKRIRKYDRDKVII